MWNRQWQCLPAHQQQPCAKFTLCDEGPWAAPGFFSASTLAFCCLLTSLGKRLLEETNNSQLCDFSTSQESVKLWGSVYLLPARDLWMLVWASEHLFPHPCLCSDGASPGKSSLPTLTI